MVEEVGFEPSMLRSMPIYKIGAIVLSAIPPALFKRSRDFRKSLERFLFITEI